MLPRCPWRLGACLAAAVALTACTRTPDPGPFDRLRPCAIEEGPTDAFCGTLAVFENRAAGTGRQIDLAIVVLPAAGTPAPDPLFFLAGGPGQGAARLAPQVRELFRPVLRTRDIVLVDQRGTGHSNPLECRDERDTLAAISEPDDAAIARLRTCLESYDADVRFYTTPIAMDDLDDVRAYLGYERINLYGGSYGTRAALVYLRRHEPRVRALVLDGVAPTDMRLPLFAARDAQRALDKLLAACAGDPACQAAHPDLRARVTSLLDRLAAAPPRVRLVHPRTGIAEEVTIEARTVASILFSALYSPLTASLVPTLVARAEENDFQGLIALAYAGEGSADNMSLGMQLSVLCSEDAPRVSEADLDAESEGSVFGGYLMRGQTRACEMWPRGEIPDGYYEPVVSDVPALILSGDVDPVTPPGWGEAVAAHLPNARHVVIPAAGHGVVATPCGIQLVREFLEAAAVDELDADCVSTLRRPPFFLSPSGPDPAPEPAP